MERTLKFDQQKIALFLKNTIIYCVVSITFYIKFPARTIVESQLLWPVWWLNEDILSRTLLILKLGLLVGPLLTFWPRLQKSGQLLTIMSALFWISIFYSNGKSYHSGRLVLIFFLVYFPLRFVWKDIRAVHLAYFVACTSYLNSGLWKIRYAFMHYWDTHDLSFLAHSLQEHIAATAVEKLKNPPLLGDLVLQSSGLSTVFWVCAIAIELTPILMFISPRRTYVLSLLYAGFHIGVVYTMNISFLESTWFHLTLAAYFYLEREKLKKYF